MPVHRLVFLYRRHHEYDLTERIDLSNINYTHNDDEEL